MKSETLRTLLGPPIAFNRSLVPLAGSVHAALMLSQALYWMDKTKDPVGWFWKSREDWLAETGLTRPEQETARRQLCARGFWKEKYQRFEHRQFYRVDMEALAGAVSRHFDEGGNPAVAKAGIQPSLGGNPAVVVLTENTQRLHHPPTPFPEKPGDPENAAPSIPREEARTLTIPPGAILPDGNNPWRAIKDQLRKSLNPRTWESWVRPTELAYIFGGKLFVAVPSAEFADWIPENFAPAIDAAKQALELEFAGIEFVSPASDR